jgi:RHS repeat-associated protein
MRVAALDVPRNEDGSFGNSSTGKLIYFHQDHLGGTVLATDEQGKIVQIYDYAPFGNQIMNESDGSSLVSHSFTDKELEKDLGLYYFEARWYNPRTGQFVSSDPMDGMSYGYAASNPLSFIDPTGLYNKETGEVESGDTLSSITGEINEYYGTNYTYSNIATINGVKDANKIYIGQIIRVGTIDAKGVIWQPPTDGDIVTVSYWNGLTGKQQMILHYHRNFYQPTLPGTQADAEAAGWTNYGNTPTHNLDGASGNVDFRGPNGEQAVYDGNGNLVTSEENMGTYDFYSPTISKYRHSRLDVAPWIRWGNSTQDSTSWWDRVRAFSN